MSIDFNPASSSQGCAKKKEGGAAVVVAIARAEYAARCRSLIGRVLGTGQLCTIVLVGRGVLPEQFDLPVNLECQPTGQHAVFKYARPAN